MTPKETIEALIGEGVETLQQMKDALEDGALLKYIGVYDAENIEDLYEAIDALAYALGPETKLVDVFKEG